MSHLFRIKAFLPKAKQIQRLNEFYEKLLSWEDPQMTVKYFVLYMLFVYYFQICWLPAFVAYRLYRNYKELGEISVILAPCTLDCNKCAYSSGHL